MLAHILDRGIIHFFASGGILLSALFAFRYLMRKKPNAYLPATILPQIIWCAICIFAVAALREAWDVAHGQPLTKAFTDYFSWAAGCGCSAWGLIRIQRGKL